MCPVAEGTRGRTARGTVRRQANGVVQVIARVAVAMGMTGAALHGQERVATFGDLGSRLRVGEMVWVTDVAGRELRGRLTGIAPDGLSLDGGRPTRLAAADIREVRRRDADPKKNGVLVGLGIGAALGTAWCVGAIADDSGEIDAGVECAEGYTVFPALGALAGLVIDAAIPGRMRVLYRQAATAGGRGLRFSVRPVLGPGTRGVLATLRVGRDGSGAPALPHHRVVPHPAHLPVADLVDRER